MADNMRLIGLRRIKGELDTKGFESEIRNDRKDGPYINIGNVYRKNNRAQFWFDELSGKVFFWSGKNMGPWYQLTIDSEFKQPWEYLEDKENKLEFPNITTAIEYIHKVAELF